MPTTSLDSGGLFGFALGRFGGLGPKVATDTSPNAQQGFGGEGHALAAPNPPLCHFIRNLAERWFKFLKGRSKFIVSLTQPAVSRRATSIRGFA